MFGIRSDLSRIQLQLSSVSTMHDGVKSQLTEQDRFIKMLFQQYTERDTQDLPVEGSKKSSSPFNSKHFHEKGC